MKSIYVITLGILLILAAALLLIDFISGLKENIAIILALLGAYMVGFGTAKED